MGASSNNGVKAPSADLFPPASIAQRAGPSNPYAADNASGMGGGLAPWLRQGTALNIRPYSTPTATGGAPWYAAQKQAHESSNAAAKQRMIDKLAAQELMAKQLEDQRQWDLYLQSIGAGQDGGDGDGGGGGDE